MHRCIPSPLGPLSPTSYLPFVRGWLSPTMYVYFHVRWKGLFPVRLILNIKGPWFVWPLECHGIWLRPQTAQDARPGLASLREGNVKQRDTWWFALDTERGLSSLLLLLAETLNAVVHATATWDSIDLKFLHPSHRFAPLFHID